MLLLLIHFSKSEPLAGAPSDEASASEFRELQLLRLDLLSPLPLLQKEVVSFQDLVYSQKVGGGKTQIEKRSLFEFRSAFLVVLAPILGVRSPLAVPIREAPWPWRGGTHRRSPWSHLKVV